MRFSLWTQIWNHSEKFNGDKEQILEKLVKYYEISSKSFSLIHKKDNLFKFSRGWKWVSALALGSEKWCYHIVEVAVEEMNGTVIVNWDIDLKLLGIQAGKNAIVEECKEIIKNNMLG